MQIRTKGLIGAGKSESEDDHHFWKYKTITFVCSFATSRDLSAAPRDVLAMFILPPFRPDIAMLNPCPGFKKYIFLRISKYQ